MVEKTPASLTPTEARYLKELQRAVERGDSPTSVYLARRLGIKPPSAIDVLERLEAKGLVRRAKWSEVRLTARGERAARELLHHHRVLEEFFMVQLGFSREAACGEASRLDYWGSCRLVRALCTLTGRPERCTHGRPLYHESCGEVGGDEG
jgi:DtxR family Mn-dependent transcriptional regulator